MVLVHNVELVLNWGRKHIEQPPYEQKQCPSQRRRLIETVSSVRSPPLSAETFCVRTDTCLQFFLTRFSELFDTISGKKEQNWIWIFVQNNWYSQVTSKWIWKCGTLTYTGCFPILSHKPYVVTILLYVNSLVVIYSVFKKKTTASKWH